MDFPLITYNFTVLGMYLGSTSRLLAVNDMGYRIKKVSRHWSARQDVIDRRYDVVPTPRQRHPQRPGRRQKKVELHVEVVDHRDVERMEKFCDRDVQLDLGQPLARARALAESEWQNEAESKKG